MRDYDVDERPIPLGRARVREADTEASPAAHIHIEEDANVEVARPATVMAEAPVVAGGRPSESVSGPAATVLNEHPTQSWVSHTQLAPTAAELAAADAHPLVAFLRFRLTVEDVERAHGSRWTGLGRLLLVYALVMALVLALILAFAVLVAHGGRVAA